MSSNNSCLQEERMIEWMKEKGGEMKETRDGEKPRQLERVSWARLSFSSFFLHSSSAWKAVWIESNNLDWLSSDEWLSNDTGLSFSLTPSLCTYLTWLLRSWCESDCAVDSFGFCTRLKRCTSTDCCRHCSFPWKSPVWFPLNPSLIPMPLRKRRTMKECEKIDNMLLQLEYELLSSSFRRLSPHRSSN